MSVRDLVSLENHPTPWWSRYALTHPVVVLRLVRQHDGHRQPWGNWPDVVMGWTLLLGVLGCLWGLAIDPSLRVRGDHPWIDALALTLVMVLAATLATGRAYQHRMAAWHRHHPRAFLEVAETFEREREGAALRRAADSACAGTPRHRDVRPARRRL